MIRKPPPQPLRPSFEGDDPDWVQASPWAAEPPPAFPSEPKPNDD